MSIPTKIPSVIRKELETVTILFAGDSGDGMQLTGTQFTLASALAGNDINTFPDFPAEIRAPAGTLPGVSGFQVSFSSEHIRTPGDMLNVLVAMNPAALKVHLNDLEKGGILIVNTDSFEAADLKKAEYAENPLETGELSEFRLFKIPITKLTLEAVKEHGLPRKQGERSKNMYALGIVYWLFDRSPEHTCKWVRSKFKKLPEIAASNESALMAGYNYAYTMELFTDHYKVKPAKLPPGRYRQITGNEALALGCVAVTTQTKAAMLLSGYPITPASDILHALSQYKRFGIKTFQAEDEIAAMCATIGAAYGGTLALTSTSGPGLALKGEALSLAAMVELPLVVVDVQRAGPSTGMPTKTEQADLNIAVSGRHGECPLPVVAPATPGDCFDVMVEAFRIALKYMTPVILLSDGYLANGAEPWRIPDLSKLPEIPMNFHKSPGDFTPYTRDAKTLARLWAVPGTPGLEHRVGGLEKDSLTGNVSYDPINHEKMVRTRAAKIDGIAQDIAPLEVYGPEKGSVLVLGWGGTYGAITAAVEILQEEGQAVSSVHLRHLFPFAANLKAILDSFDRILVPELNAGQLCQLLRAKYGIDFISFPKVQGKPFLVSEIRNRVLEILSAMNGKVQG